MAFIPQPGHFQPEQVWGDCGVAKSFKATASFGNLFFKCRRFFAYGKGVYLTLTLGNRGLSTALHFRVYVVLDPQDDSNNACHPPRRELRRDAGRSARASERPYRVSVPVSFAIRKGRIYI